MDTKNPQFLEYFYSQNFEEIKGILIEVDGLATKWGVELGEYQSFWTLLNHLRQEAEYDWTDDPFESVSKRVLSFLPIESLNILKEFILQIGNFTPGKMELPVAPPETGKVDALQIRDIFKKFSVSDNTVENWFKILNAKPTEEQQKIFFTIFGVQEVLVDLRKKMEIVCGWFKFIDPNYRFYNISQVEEKMKDRIVEDHARLLGSMADLTPSEDGKYLSLLMMDYAEKYYITNDTRFSWEDVMFFTVFLHVMWMNFVLYGEREQQTLLQRFFYRAVAADVNVRPSLEEILYRTYTLVDYLERNAFLVEGLRLNTEVISGVSLKDLLVANPTPSPEQFLETLKEKPVELKAVEKIMEFFPLLANAQLIERNHRGEKTEKDLDVERVSKVVEMFLVKDSWEKFAEYYSQENPEVPFARVYNELKENMDLEKDAAVEMLLSFSEFLHEKNILSNDQELIEFHEDDGKFHWNENLTF